MKTKQFNETEIVRILKQCEEGASVTELCREHCMSSDSFYEWHAKHNVIDSQIKCAGEELIRMRRRGASVEKQSDFMKEARRRKD